MKKRLTILSAVGLMTLTALTGCGKGYSYNDGVMVYINGTAYTTDQLFESYGLDDKAGVSAYYNALYDVSIEATIAKDQDMISTVNNDLKDFMDTAETTAKNNGTTKAEEVENALTKKGFDTIEEYENSLYLEAKKTKAESNYGSDSMYTDTLIPNMVENFAPYHPRHILVKFSSDATKSTYQGTIGSTDAQSISSIISRLANGESFGSVAADSDDSSATPSEMASNLNFGDTSIMTTKTSFVSEFKYGIYTYDAFFNNELTTTAKKKLYSQAFSSDADNVSEYEAYMKAYAGDDKAYAYGIPYSAVLGLNYYYDRTTATNGLTVTDAQTYNYPRNVIFNNYFNNHGLSFIYLDNPTTEPNGDANEDKYYNATTYAALNSASDSSVSHFEGTSPDVGGIVSNLQVFSESDATHHKTGANKLSAHKVLVDELGHPIMATRAGTGSGDSGYQGIHLIIIQKDPFTTSESDMTKYYTLDKPSTTASDSTLGTTYVSFVNTDTRSIYNDRVDALKSAVDLTVSNKEYDRFYYYLTKATTGSNDNGVKITVDSKIMTAVNSYISAQEGNTAESAQRSYDSSWQTYTRNLGVFKDYSSRILPMSGIQAFLNNDIDTYNAAIAAGN